MAEKHPNTITPIFEKVAIIGLGLIGSSIMRGALQYGLANKVHGFDLDEKIVARADALNIKGVHFTNDLKGAVKEADLIILAIPVGAMGKAAGKIIPLMKKGAILSDVGSVKQSVINGILPHLTDDIIFIPAHPVAGTEYSGPEAGFSTLFQDRWSILTPEVNTDKQALNHLIHFWKGLGAKVEIMTPDHHDLVLAITSHLPHLIAYNIVGTAADLESVTQKEVIKYSAGGFRDFTRIAASDPIMWRDIFLNNRDAVLEMLKRFQNDFDELKSFVEQSDGPALEALFTRTRKIRRSIIEAGQETGAPDFGRLGEPEDVS